MEGFPIEEGNIGGDLIEVHVASDENDGDLWGDNAAAFCSYLVVLSIWGVWKAESIQTTWTAFSTLFLC